MKNTDEIRRLLNGPLPDETPSGALVTFRAECDKDATDVLQALREVWATALWQTDPDRLSGDEWKMILPRWFVSQFDPGIHTEDPLLRRAFQLRERMSPGEAWTLSDWVRSVGSTTRGWAWWAAEVIAPYRLEVRAVVQPGGDLGALQWTMRCAGAQSLERLGQPPLS